MTPKTGLPILLASSFSSSPLGKCCCICWFIFFALFGFPVDIGILCLSWFAKPSMLLSPRVAVTPVTATRVSFVVC